ncbi:MAG: FAD-dependent oxidoreductase [Gammaproteobacteria bacterium]
MKHVIIGAGPAGVVAAETLRKLDPDSTITLIGDEPEPPYSRMAIPYLLVENIDESGTYLRKDSQHYQAKNIQILHERVTRVEPGTRNLTLQNGSTLAYDRLLICTGSTPIRPPIPGMDLEGVHNCWTLEDARRIAQSAKPGAKVILIGAGFIGCIILEALAGRGVDLTVVEMGDRMVPRMMDETAGGLIKRWCEGKGIKVHTATKVDQVASAQTASTGSGTGGGLKKLFSALTGSAKPAASEQQGGHRFKVTLSNGQVLDADLVISAAGVKPNTQLLEGSGVDIDNGILVNHYLQTNIPEIYAAGDVARGRDFSTGEFEVHAIQPTATEHGRIAAQNMAGVETRYDGSFNMNVLDTLGLISSSFGLWMGTEGGDSAQLLDAENYRYLNLQFQDDILVGATSLGLTQHVGVLRGLIQGKVRLGSWKEKLMEDPSRIMDAYLAMNYTAQHAA